MGSDNIMHGGDIFGRDIIYDFSSNVNPLGMPENVKKALVSSVGLWERYPDSRCRELIEKLSVYENIPKENIVCGNGADDIIFRLAQALNINKILICAPTFGEYERAFSNAQIKRYMLYEEYDFRIREDILNYTDNIDAVIICSPNNPTGLIPDTDIMRKLSEKCREDNIIFICDECFLDFAENSKNLSIINYFDKNIIILKAFTKVYAMAGLRLGYAVFGDKNLAGRVRNSGQYWSVSYPAQIAGAAALDEEKYISDTVIYIRNEREYLTENLKKLGIKTFNSAVNFILLKTDIPLYDILLKEKILIRKCGNYSGLDDNFYRIAVRTHKENLKLLQSIHNSQFIIHNS
ncbi:MAG: aminotransferase class I/II-fold pyridoxal phosphate-dependent enzyme [Ruminococcus sp.]|nr:aminotransferase class I/II-fold pyridoxal phosphate-dependent enzyme [Ruminococcus sp.]